MNKPSKRKVKAKKGSVLEFIVDNEKYPWSINLDKGLEAWPWVTYWDLEPGRQDIRELVYRAQMSKAVPIYVKALLFYLTGESI